MSIRREFAEEAERGLYSMTELCARFGISRRVGYKWVGRYESAGLAGLEDQRRVAAHYPNRMADEVAAALLACRQAHPTWARGVASGIDRSASRTKLPISPAAERGR